MLTLAASLVTSSAALAQPVDFTRDVRPILSNHCFACHGPDAEAREGGLSLVTFEEATMDVIVPGDRGASLLWERLRDDDDPMPPREVHNDLDEEQIEILGRWIDQGATYAPHWAYVEPVATPLPDVRDETWPETDIDRRILARLEALGLAPVPDADRATLVRRVTLDLTGLPPTVEDVDDFVENDDPQAFEQVVDRLLESPAFAERLAMLWLDLVRYADTVGYHGDQEHHVSPYRDWVIWAFRERMPFDEFTIAQIAGDLLPDPTDEARLASCYNRLIQTSHEGGVQMKEYAAIYAADRVANVSEVWMGATMGCAQCHDHKYDPYTARDFYTMAAFFADIDDLDHLKNGGNAPNSTPTRRVPEVDLLSPLDRERRAILDAMLESASEEDAPAIRERLDRLKPRRVMVTKATEPRVTRLLPRGDWLDESGPVVEPAVPAFMGDLELDRRATRLDLARWLVDADDGAGRLTARVMVNRIWAMLHGQGLCPSLDDFGGQGRPPTHPELLDDLAIDFASDWDLHRLVRRIVLSRTYRLSSVPTPEMRRQDPDNLLFARQTARRVQAETVRDIALSVSGLLVDDLGGSSVKPYQPTGYYQHLNFPKREYETHLDDRQWKRGLYVHWQRQFVHPTFKAFDAPTREACTAKRATSNTPLAALALLNDPTFVEASRAFGARIAHHDGDDRDRLAWAWRTATARTPDDRELDVLVTLLDGARAHFEAHPDDASNLASVGIAPKSDLDPVEHAAWTEVARAILNLHETITRS